MPTATDRVFIQVVLFGNPDNSEGASTMRTLKTAAVFTAVVGGAILLLGAPTPQAAVLTTGAAGHPANPPFGGYVCADVRGGSLSAGVPIQAWDCHAGPNQQFEFNSLTIYALGAQACVDVSGGGTAAGTPVQLWPCNGTAAQQWYYYNGEIYNPHSGKCLDAQDMVNGRQLVINSCDAATGENWQIK
jgi:hypothetical protein